MVLTAIVVDLFVVDLLTSSCHVSSYCGFSNIVIPRRPCHDCRVWSCGIGHQAQGPAGPSSTETAVISQPSGAALTDLTHTAHRQTHTTHTLPDLGVGCPPPPQLCSSPESRSRPPLLIYEPFHTALLPLESQPWLVRHTLNTPNTKHYVHQ